MTTEIVEKIIKYIKFQTAKSAIDQTIGHLLEKNANAGSNVEVLRRTMADIAEIQFGRGTRPFAFMMHFLNGRGHPVDIDLKELFHDDHAVRDRVVSETYRRVLHGKTIKEKAESSRMTSKFAHGIDPVITIKQANYSNDGWRNALGTYDLTIVQLGMPGNDKSPIPVVLTSDNIYRWHAADKRMTQTIHMMGQTLVDLRAAHDFEMRTRSATMLIDQVNAKFLQMVTTKQTDPQYDHPIIGNGAIERAINVFGF